MKLNLICGKDDLRPLMTYVKVTRENMVATNGHALGVIPTKKLFNEEFIEKIPESGFLILADDYAKLLTANGIEWSSEKLLTYLDKKYNPCYVPIRFEEDDFTYPNWEQIIPKEKDRTAQLNYVGIDLKIALSLQSALGFRSCKFTFSGLTKAIFVECASNQYDDCAESYGLLMPVMVNNLKKEEKK